jgi:hypothetical protein
MPSRKQIDECWRNIKKMLKELNYEILQDLNDKDGNFIGLLIKYGAHQVQIIHRPNLNVVSVAFRIDFDEDAISKIKGFQKNDIEWRKFLFSFKTQVTSPMTENFFNTDSEDNLTGFIIQTNIFPFHKGFSIEKLYNAIRSVVSVGFKGIVFLISMFGKEVKVETTPEPPPHTVYG